MVKSELANEQGLAAEAIQLYSEISRLTEQLTRLKESLRDLADGHTKEIIVDGLGRVHISAPFAGSETAILVLDESKLSLTPDLRDKLLNDGIARQDVKKVPACAAKVTIKPS